MTAVAHPRPPLAPTAAERRPVAGRGSPTGWVAVGLAVAGAGLLAARAASITPGPCTLRAHVGIACPVCGITRLSVAVAHGHLATAAARDLPGLLLLLALAATAAAQVAAVQGRPPAWLRRPWLPVLLVALLLAHWAVTLATGGFAP